MHIISGKFKGRIIEMPEGIRPTSQKVREALFNILKNRIQGALFLDLYCGSGAIGIEALSQGASKVIFVDDNHNALAILKKNLISLKLPISDIYSIDVIKGLDVLKKNEAKFDVVFLDPPYHRAIAKNTLIKLSSCDILTPNAVVIAEIFKKEFLPEKVGSLTKTRTYKYGDTILEFYKT
jgi:16S rRNA (guanine(966)-N(2))-methyltransferase RsmD